jgi:tRNA nucleotidyltransferase/poly(A) polymerase
LNKRHNEWITLGIKTSCKRKRWLFLASKNDKNPDLLRHYKIYCKILSSVIREAKRRHYADQIVKATNNNLKKIWNIINQESNRTGTATKISALNVNGDHISEPQKIANEFNKYFITMAKSITVFYGL